MTGSIGLHHVHHLDPRIPSYSLRRCHEENGELHAAPTITLRGSLHSFSLRLWDPDRRRMVSFGDLAPAPAGDEPRRAPEVREA
jgi:omega-6 fatty acid desaturase (delta-12 desaturase)